MENLGTAKGHIDLDFGKLSSSVKSALTELQKIEDESKKVDSEIAVLQSTANDTGNAFDKAAEKSKTLANQLEAAKSKVQVYEKEMGLLKTQIVESQKAQTELAKKLTETKSKYEVAKTAVANLATKYEDSKKALDDLKNSQDATDEAVKAAKDTVKKYADELKTAKQHMGDYADEVNDLENKQKLLAADIETGKEKLEQFGTECNYAQADVNNLTRELAETRDTAKLFGEYMQDAGEKLQGVGDKLESIGSGLSAKITAPLSAAGTAATKMALDVEQSFAKVESIADTSAVSMGEIQGGAREISDETGVGLTAFNDALYQTISATADTRNALDYTAVAAKAAKGGFTETATAVDILTTFMNTYGLEGADAMEMVADKMLVTQNYGKTTFGDLAQTMGRVIPTAKNAGLSIDELLSIMAVLTRNGLKTENAVTGLNAALSNIISPSSEATEAAAALGLNWNSAELEAKGFTGMMQEVRAALEQASPEYAELAKSAAEYDASISDMAGTQEANTKEIEALEETNKELKKQMDSVKESAGSSSLAYKDLNNQYKANKERITDLKAENKSLKTEQAALTKESKGLSDKMSVLATAADSPIGAFAQLFGSTEALNAVMVLASDTGMDNMTTSMDMMTDSAGTMNKAFETMDKTNLSKLQKSVNRLKNTAVDAGNKIAPVVADGADKVADLVGKFSELDDAEQETILKTAAVAAAAGPALVAGGKVIKSVGQIGSGIGGLVKTLSTLSGGGVAAAAATAIAGVGLACAAAYDRAVENDLAEHFGTVKLSAEEVEDVVERITATPWTATLDVYSTAVDDLNAIKDSIQSTVDEINKTQWKIDTGIALTDEEKEAYKTDVATFVGQVQEYVEQQHFTTSLAIKAVYGDDDADTSFSDSVYGGLNDELTRLGTELSDLVNDAFENNMLDDEATRALIQSKEKEIQDVLDDIAQARYDVQMQNIVASVPDGSLTSDSFRDVQAQLTEQMQAKKDEIEAAQIDVMVPYRVQFNRGEIDEEEYNQKVTETMLEATERMGEVDLQGVKYEIQTITGTYTDANDKAAAEYTASLKDSFQKSLEKLDAGSLSFEQFFSGLETVFGSGYEELSGKEQAAIRKLLKEMEPQKEELENLAAQYVAAGATVPDSIREGIDSIERLEAMTGSIDAAYSLLAQQIADSPELQAAVSEAYASGAIIPGQITEALQSRYPDVYDATIGIFDQMTSGEQMKRAELTAAFTALGVDCPDYLVAALGSKSGEVQAEVMEMLQMMKQGTALVYPQLETLFADIGVTLPDALINELMYKSPDVQAQVISLLSEIMTADETKRPELIEQMKECGVDIDQSIIDGMIENMPNVELQADATVQGIHDRVDGADGGTVEISTNDPAEEAQSWWDRFTSMLSGARTSVNVNAGGSIRGYADGGMVTTEQIAAIAENDNPEMIIPLSSQSRTRALALYEQTGQIIGADKGLDVSDKSNAAELAAEIAGRLEMVLRNTPINIPVEINMEDGDVQLDGERVGRKLAPTISRIQGQRR